MADYDLAIVGGGLTGTSIARDAAGRGLRVVLFEQGDLASGASSASARLMTGDLGRLEKRALPSVRTALLERDLQLRLAPHLVRPARFVIPLHPDARPAWLLRAGLSIYDRLGAARISASTTLDLTHHEAGFSLQRPFGVAFEFSDGVADDSRLVIANALDAAARGASIRTQTRCVRADRDSEWRLGVIERGRRHVVTARALVSAVGAWTVQFAETVLRLAAPPLDLVRETQIVVRRLFEHGRVYVLQHSEQQLVFASPYPGGLTLIGTARGSFRGDLAAVAPVASDIAELCSAANRYFREPISPTDVVRVICTVRPRARPAFLQALPRYGAIRLDRRFREAPLVTTFGGDLTTYRLQAQKVVQLLSPFFVLSAPWTAKAPLPGGDFDPDQFGEQVFLLRDRYPFLQPNHAVRLIEAYGTRATAVLGSAGTFEELGPHFGGSLTGCEVRYLTMAEWARTAEDVLWRRSKLGLSMPPAARDDLAQFIKSGA